MKTVYLSPSSQEYNIGVGDFGTEKDYCNRLADIICEKFSQNDKVRIVRSNHMYLHDAIQESNIVTPDLHLALHTNSDNGKATGPETFCYKKGGEGERFSQIVQKKLAELHGVNRGVKEGKNFYGKGKSMIELEGTIAPASLVEFAFHDNLNDVKFLLDNINLLADIIEKSINEFFGIKNIKHWADNDFDYLNKQGINIGEKRYNDWMTRAEVISLMAKILKITKG